MKLLVSVHQIQVSDLISSISFVDNVLGIYLMFNGDCYPNGLYINRIYITKDHANYSPLKCALANTALDSGFHLMETLLIVVPILSIVTKLLIQLASVYTDQLM